MSSVSLLKRHQRQALLAGKTPKLDHSNDHECLYTEGQTIKIAPEFEIQILTVRAQRKSWKVEYLVRDNRPRFLSRRAPRIKDSLDNRNWTYDQEHGYTDQTGSALLDAGEAVPAAYQQQIAEEAQEKWEQYILVTRPAERTRQRVKKLTNALQKKLKTAVRTGADVTPTLEAAIDSLKQIDKKQKDSKLTEFRAAFAF